MITVGRVDQLRGVADAITALAHTAFQHIPNHKLLADLADIG